MKNQLMREYKHRDARTLLAKSRRKSLASHGIDIIYALLLLCLGAFMFVSLTLV